MWWCPRRYRYCAVRSLSSCPLGRCVPSPQNKVNFATSFLPFVTITSRRNKTKIANICLYWNIVYLLWTGFFFFHHPLLPDAVYMQIGYPKCLVNKVTKLTKKCAVCRTVYSARQGVMVKQSTQAPAYLHSGIARQKHLSECFPWLSVPSGSELRQSCFYHRQVIIDSKCGTPRCGLVIINERCSLLQLLHRHSFHSLF